MNAALWALLVFAVWFVSGVLLSLVLYVGYGFVMAARRAEKEGRSQVWVSRVDRALAFQIVLLDAFLNVYFYATLMLDFRWSHTWNLVTGRLDLYSLNPDERPWRRAFASFMEAFLGGKDMRGFHIKGIIKKFSWLG